MADALRLGLEGEVEAAGVVVGHFVVADDDGKFVSRDVAILLEAYLEDNVDYAGECLEGLACGEVDVVNAHGQCLLGHLVNIDGGLDFGGHGFRSAYWGEVCADGLALAEVFKGEGLGIDGTQGVEYLLGGIYLDGGRGGGDACDAVE